ncbi:MAG: hypothetical protein JOZ69_08940 [Myxococcales bacterium]|nr:hypothetical protein [Myxococcales bacterium]
MGKRDWIIDKLGAVPFARLAHELTWATTPEGTELPLGDGGTFDWLMKLTSSRRAAFVASGAGAQLVPIAFRDQAPSRRT